MAQWNNELGFALQLDAVWGSEITHIDCTTFISTQSSELAHPCKGWNWKTILHCCSGARHVIFICMNLIFPIIIQLCVIHEAHNNTVL